MFDNNVFPAHIPASSVTEIPTDNEVKRRQATISIAVKRPGARLPLIHQEKMWRMPEELKGAAHLHPRVIATRWRGTEQSEHVSEMFADYNLISINLKPSEVSLWLEAVSFPHYAVGPGAVQISRPSSTARVVYHKPYDVLHLYANNSLLKECFEWSHGKTPAGEISLRDPYFGYDAVLKKLSTTLVSISNDDEGNDGLLADFLSLSVVTRILKLYGDCPPATSRKVAALPNWRLRRAIECMEAHTYAPVTLADLARAAGLSRMYFAAQFRAATGMRPHEYLLRLRIKKAQTMLVTSDTPIVEVALILGFASQPHFTTVFKRVVGVTPNCWRQSHLA
jgi:AraC-like DNA-binding protein